MPTNHFDEPDAATFDDLSAEMFAPEVLDPTVVVLAAIPLAQQGVRVHGIDLSPAMLRRLRAKPGRTG